MALTKVTSNVLGNSAVTSAKIALSNTGLTFNDGSNQMTAASGFGFKNRIINGAMMINQRGVTTLTVNNGNSSTVGGTYFQDRFILPSATAVSQYSTTPSAFTCAVTNNAASIGYPFCFSITVNTAGVGGTNRDISFISHKVEVGNLSDLAYGTSNAQPATLSFWIRSSLIGQRSLFIYSPITNRYIQPSFTINAANTWEYKTITIPGDTTASFGTTMNAEAIRIEFRTSCSGTTLAAATNTWATLSSQRAVTGDVDFFGTVGATLDITGIQFEKGPSATSFDHRPYGLELSLCQRYYATINNPGNVSYARYSLGLCRSTGTSSMDLYVHLPVPMRTTPVFSTTGSFVMDPGAIAVSSISLYSAIAGYQYIALAPVTASSMSVGPISLVQNATTQSSLNFSAEL